MSGGKKEKQKKQLPYEWRRVNYFFTLFDEESSTEHLWKMLKLALTNEEENTEGSERSNMIFFYEHITELVENIYILSQEKKKENKKEPSPAST